jgi:hypothetical protein
MHGNFENLVGVFRETVPQTHLPEAVKDGCAYGAPDQSEALNEMAGSVTV